MTHVYGVTWGDMELTPRHVSWQMLRALRHNPPGLAGEEQARSSLFSAALEQAEQFFRAAEATETDTRPLMLFYGLAQSGRALLAAADPTTGWGRARGHGLKVAGESVDTSLSSTLLTDQSRGLFLDVGRTLQRATLGGAGHNVGALSRLGRLGSRFPLPGEEPEYPPLRLRLRSRGLIGHPQSLRAELIVPSASWSLELPAVGGRTTEDYDAYKDHVRKRLLHYPTLHEAQLAIDAPGHFDLGGSGEERFVALEWPNRRHPAIYEDEVVVLREFGDGWGSTVTVQPAQSGSTLPVHPYLLWWAVLYAMSHYVRYEPARWAQIIDVDHSGEAVAVEHLCRQALDVLPELIHRTLARNLS